MPKAMDTHGYDDSFEKQQQAALLPSTPDSGPKGLMSTRLVWVNLTLMSASFLLAFTAFNGVQNLESSLNMGDVSGHYAVAIIYIVFTLACLLGPRMVKVLGSKTCIMLQQVFITLFVASQLYPRQWTVYPAAALLGFGASAMWVGQGEYVTCLAAHHAARKGLTMEQVTGTFQGVFFFFFQLSQVTGNLCSALVLKPDTDGKGTSSQHTIDLLFVVYVIALATSFVVMGMAMAVKPPPTMAGAVQEEKDVGFLDVIMLLFKPRLLLFVPLFLANGLELGYITGCFTSQFIANTGSLGQHNIGYVMTVFGVSNAISSAGMGKLSDMVGRRTVFFMAFVIHFTLALSIIILPHTFHGWGMLMATVGVWAIGDAIWNTVISAVLSSSFQGDTEAAFGAFKCFQSLGLAIAFFFSDHNDALLVGLLSCLVLGGLSYSILTFVLKADSAANKLS